MTKKMILPIAIDLGAKNTGVFSAVYPHGTDVAQVDTKMGKVYGLTKDSYTLLMDSRTAKRHQRRGLDRKQLVKRLFKLIWTKQLNLEWNDYTQQTLSFLLNRRGFSFLEEKHDSELLKHFPSDAINCLPQKLSTDNTDSNDYDLNSKIFELLESDSFADVYNEIEGNTKKVKRDMVISSTISLIKSAVENKILSNTIEITKANKLDRLEKVSNWIVEFLISQNDNIDKSIIEEKSYSCDLLKYISKLEDNELYDFKESLPLFDEKALKDSLWNFNISNFNLESDANIKKLEESDIKTHIHHLAFALHNIKKELDEGSRHRSKYFEEVANVLLETNHQELYLKTFCQNLHNDKYTSLTVKKLTNLIGNISNLELKPLRKYFNDKAHAKADYWDEKRFAETYCRWILGEWRVGSKDKDKQSNAKYDYKILCNDIKQQVGATKDIKASIVKFMLDLDPCRTVPPYQDNNNRKPPKCQSLILNPNFLDTNYPSWQDDLANLKKLDSVQEYLETFEQELKDLKTGKDKSYFVEQKSCTCNTKNTELSRSVSAQSCRNFIKYGSCKTTSGQRDYKDLDAKILQFIFDRVKATDELLLNEIYSLAKKVKQNSSSDSEKANYTQKLGKVIAESKLPDSLKSNHTAGIFIQGTFLHLVCRYFKHRQRARDSRLYIMPEYNHDKKLDKWNNTGRFDDNGKLLTYCNHKPRQKRYQLLNDLAGALQVSPKLLVEKVGSDNELQILEWLKTFRIGGYCKAAVEMQKQYRGTLKLAINKAIFRQRIENIRKDKKAIDEDKAILEKYSNTKAPTADEKKLVKLVDNINKSTIKITESLGLELTHSEKFNSIFSFAQIQQIAFAERSGNANTCAVCSVDNAHRMQQTKLTEHSRSELQSNSVVTSTGSVTLDRVSTKAQRLPAISTRVIDGAVKKMATILARNIVDDNWDNVKQALENNEKLSIPIITESNAFEFEPSLSEIKGTKKKDTTTKEELFAKKEDRIKDFAKTISAYSGKPLGEDTELDHIIPRSNKKYGTLNDEANLICVSREDNQSRGNTAYYLSNIANNYKELQFGTTDSQTIESWIAKTIWNDEKQDFKFGNYRSFINLTEQEQVAFRHALFLADDNPIKQAVIRAINNRNRTFVNGTQRYFAEVLANNFYLRAKKEGLDTTKLDFDYFGVETTNTAGRGVTDVRKLYENLDDDISTFAKSKDKSQDSYSHLIDAMLAFCVVADEHKDEGSIGLKMGGKYGLFPTPNEYDADTGEILTWLDDDIFKQIKVADNEFEVRVLARRKAYTVETNIRQEIQAKGDFKKSIPYKIHIDSLSAEKYFPLLELSEDKWKFGFSLDNSIDITKKDIELIKEFLNKSKKYSDYTLWLINKTQAQEYLIDLGFNGADKEQEKIAKILDKLNYTTIKKEISNVLTKGNKTPDTIEEALVVFDELVFKSKNDKFTNFVKSGVLLPVYDDWVKLKKTMLKEENDQKLNVFLSKYFESTNSKNKHQKVRKNFSLPVVSTIGSIRLRRKSWDGKNIYQVTGDESLAKYGFDGVVRPKTILSKNSVPIKHYQGIEKENTIEPLNWIEIDKNSLVDDSILSAEIKNRSAGQVSIKVELCDLDNICLKEVNWSGSIVYTLENDENNTINSDKFYIKKEDFFWLKDFSLMFDSGKTKATLYIKKNGDKFILEFVSSKDKKAKQWLKNETLSN